MISSLLATKLHRPPAPAKPVRRPRLLDKLDEGLAAGHRLTLVSAPAGFGKTTCVIEWLDRASLPVAWLSLEPADDDPGRFFSYLIAALQEVDPSIGREMEPSLKAPQFPSVASMTTGLVNDILRAGARFALVLDDLHALHGTAVLQVVETLIAGGPENLHLVLITREDPPLPLARLRAHNKMTELRAADLRFSEDEAAGLLIESMALSLSPADIAALEKRTEGWVAGLQLAGLSLRGQSDPAGFIARLSGSHRYILGYLTEEVLDRQPGEVQDFLLKTSILDRLNEELSAAVTGREDCGRLLQRAYAANLFLIQLDEDGEWYRYHHLFAQLLHTRLRQTASADQIKALHSWASDWLAGHGQVDEAIRQALEGRDYERAVLLVDRVAASMIYSGRMHTLRSWIDAFPLTCRPDYPRLDAYRTWIDLLEGKLDFGEKAAQAREDVLASLPPSPENDRLRVELTAILCRYSPLFGDTQRTIRLGQAALKTVDAQDLVSRARLLFGLAVAHALEGKTAESEDAFAECLRLATATGDDGLAAEVLALGAQDKAHCGHLSEAARLYGQILDLPVRQAEARLVRGEAPLAGMGYLGLADIYLERYELERAEATVERGMELCARGGLDAIYSGYGIRSRLRQARGDLPGALAEIETVERTFRRGDDPLLATQRVLIARAVGDTAEIARLLEPWVRLLEGASAGLGPRPPDLVLDVVRVLVAQGYLALGQEQKTLELLAEVEPAALRDGRFGLLVRVHLLTALALQAQGRASAARQSLVSALRLAEPEGYVLVFLEELPPVGPLLSAIREDVSVDERMRRYAGKLLSVSAAPDREREGEPASGSSSAVPGHEGGRDQAGQDTLEAEQLSARELEILRLIGEGRTNQEIAGRLVITLHTVKKHSSNIFGKLGVSSRTQAVAAARRLGLLD